MFYVFHGDDQFGMSEALAGLRGKLADGDRVMGDLNTTTLEGRRTTFGEIRHACDAVPFMADRRLVIVHSLLAHLVPGGKGQSNAEWKRKFLEELSDYLPHLPSTTRLIFVEEKALKPSHPILKVAKEEGKRGRGHIREFPLPKESKLPRWIRERAEEKGGEISHEAVTVLAALVGTDLRLLDQEIEKLLLYADGRRVTSDDVALLVSRARETSIFDLVDCVGRRQTGPALKLLHRMLDEGEPALYLLAMLARQVRILIQVKELSKKDMNQVEIARDLNMHPFVAKKGLEQARNFDMSQLEAAHEKLVEADWAIKTGQAQDVLALDALVVALTRI
jgi:DNA polymerase-3 subunit delta